MWPETNEGDEHDITSNQIPRRQPERNIWRNTGDKGTYYTANPQRSYKQGDETWKETDSLSGDDLLAMAELLREAYAWIKMQRKADAAGRKQADNVTAR